MGVSLSPSLIPVAYLSPCVSGVQVLAGDERVHLLTGSDVRFFSCVIRNTEYALHRPAYVSTHVITLPASVGRFLIRLGVFILLRGRVSRSRSLVSWDSVPR